MARRPGRRSGILSLRSYLRRTSINRGLFGDDRFWRTVFLIIFGRKVLRKMMGSEPETVALETLKPGQFVRIEAIDPQSLEPPKKRRRKR